MSKPDDTEDILREIALAVSEIKSILLLTHREAVDKGRQKLLPEGSVKKQIYELCDGTGTSKDIADAVKKETKYVSAYLTRLRREGLIRIIYRDGKEVHEQTM